MNLARDVHLRRRAGTNAYSVPSDAVSRPSLIPGDGGHAFGVPLRAAADAEPAVEPDAVDVDSERGERGFFHEPIGEDSTNHDGWKRTGDYLDDAAHKVQRPLAEYVGALPVNEMRTIIRACRAV